MSLPNSLYANLTVVGAGPRASVVERKAAAVSEAADEALLKQSVEKANRVLDKLEARDAVLAGYIKALQKQRAANAGRIERIEDAVLTYMDENGLKLLAGVRCSLRSQPAAASLVVVDETLIPAEYFRQPARPPAAPDKVAIKAALGANENLVPAAWGVKLVSKISLIRK